MKAIKEISLMLLGSFITMLVFYINTPTKPPPQPVTHTFKGIEYVEFPDGEVICPTIDSMMMAEGVILEWYKLKKPL